MKTKQLIQLLRAVPPHTDVQVQTWVNSTPGPFVKNCAIVGHTLTEQGLVIVVDTGVQYHTGGILEVPAAAKARPW